jgi:hypothetical protein
MDSLHGQMRSRFLMVVGVLSVLVATAFGSTDYGMRLGSIRSRGGVPPNGAQTEIAVANLAVLPAEAEAQSRIQPLAPTERSRALGVARITLARPLRVVIPMAAPHRSRATSRAALAPARSPPLAPVR